jgi:hypothetical protein
VLVLVLRGAARLDSVPPPAAKKATMAAVATAQTTTADRRREETGVSRGGAGRAAFARGARLASLLVCNIVSSSFFLSFFLFLSSHTRPSFCTMWSDIEDEDIKLMQLDQVDTTCFPLFFFECFSLSAKTGQRK